MGFRREGSLQPVLYSLQVMDQYLLEKLKCPHCPNGALTAQEPESLRCAACGRTYLIVDGVPDLLPESGRVVELPKQAPVGATGAA